jgi:hypothetical protein
MDTAMKIIMIIDRLDIIEDAKNEIHLGILLNSYYWTGEFPSSKSFFSLANSFSVIIPCPFNFPSFVSSSAIED